MIFLSQPKTSDASCFTKSVQGVIITTRSSLIGTWESLCRHSGLVDKQITNGSEAHMNRIIRIIGAKLLLLVRLAVVLSLTGYSFSQINVAMHGSAVPSFVAMDTIADSVDHSMVGTDMADHHQTSGDSDATDGSGNQNCCKSFCANAALADFCPTFGVVRLTSLRFAHFDELLPNGMLAPIHNPPSA